MATQVDYRGLSILPRLRRHGPTRCAPIGCVHNRWNHALLIDHDQLGVRLRPTGLLLGARQILFLRLVSSSHTLPLSQ